jgi:hypothetical protein
MDLSYTEMEEQEIDRHHSDLEITKDIKWY